MTLISSIDYKLDIAKFFELFVDILNIKSNINKANKLIPSFQ
jgi:hypothetical protein